MYPVLSGVRRKEQYHLQKWPMWLKNFWVWAVWKFPLVIQLALGPLVINILLEHLTYLSGSYNRYNLFDCSGIRTWFSIIQVFTTLVIYVQLQNFACDPPLTLFLPFFYSWVGARGEQTELTEPNCTISVRFGFIFSRISVNSVFRFEPNIILVRFGFWYKISV